MVGLMHPEAHRGAVERSWDRCLEYSLEPKANAPILRVQQSELAPRRDALAEALGDIRTETDALAEIALRAGYCVVVTDPDCVVLDMRADRAALDAVERVGLMPGSCWSERLAGTNGVSLAQSQSTLFTARGQDHFFRDLKDFACTGVPFRAADGSVLGILTLSCVDRDHTGDYVLAQHLLRQSAERIEARLFARAHANRHLVAPMAHAPAGALLALDDAATIVAATPAATALGAKAGLPLVGKAFEEVFETRPPPPTAPSGAVSLAGRTGRLPPRLRDMAGEDPRMHRAIAKADRLLALGLPILLLGAPATGKHALAQDLLRAGGRPVERVDGPALVASGNAGPALSRTLTGIDRRLEKGASIALFISQLELLSQEAFRRLAAWLLRRDRDGLLQGPRARVICVATAATDDAVEGLESLFASHRIVLPALAERRDLPDLIARTHARLAGAEGTIAPETLDALAQYDWPGNLRELEAVLLEATAVSGRNTLLPRHLPDHILASRQMPDTAGPDLETVLAQTRWNVTRAARQMGISRATINRRIKAAGLRRPTPNPA